MPPFCCYNYFGVEFSYEKYHVHHGGDQEEKKANYTDMVRQFSLIDAGSAFYFYLD